ncbi:AlpA family phage regulatory protein [Pseudomonas sp. CW003PS]|nr:AlpA family phage regulatory protein [Pseudomonas sp. CW003PS]
MKCGFKRSHIYNLIKLGRFPAPIKIGARAVAWDLAEVEEWMAQRIEQPAAPISWH